MTKRRLGMAVIASLPTIGSAPSGFSGEVASRVAIALEVKGDAAVTAPTAGEVQPLRRFQWLAAGTRLDARKGRLLIAFVNGRRWDAQPGARGLVGAEGPIERSGPWRELPPVPVSPLVVEVAAGAKVGSAPGAERFRGGEAGLYPRGTATAIAGTTTLRFRPVAGASEYRISVMDAQQEVLAAVTPVPELVLPSGVLRAGRSYRWTVSVLGLDPPPSRPSACFRTLDDAVAARRSQLREALAREDSASSLALLATCDLSLGLLQEARDAFAEALSRAPGDEGLAGALADLDKRLDEESDCLW